MSPTAATARKWRTLICPIASGGIHDADRTGNVKNEIEIHSRRDIRYSVFTPYHL